MTLTESILLSAQASNSIVVVLDDGSLEVISREEEERRFAAHLAALGLVDGDLVVYGEDE